MRGEGGVQGSVRGDFRCSRGSKSMPEYVPGLVTFQAISAFETQNAILGAG